MTAALFTLALFGPADYAECLLDRLAGAQNDPVAAAIVRGCAEEFPSQWAGVKKRDDSGGRKCVLERARSTSSPLAARLMQRACYALHEPEPKLIPFDGQLDPK